MPTKALRQLSTEEEVLSAIDDILEQAEICIDLRECRQIFIQINGKQEWSKLLKNFGHFPYLMVEMLLIFSPMNLYYTKERLKDKPATAGEMVAQWSTETRAKIKSSLWPIIEALQRGLSS